MRRQADLEGDLGVIRHARHLAVRRRRAVAGCDAGRAVICAISFDLELPPALFARSLRGSCFVTSK